MDYNLENYKDVNHTVSDRKEAKYQTKSNKYATVPSESADDDTGKFIY